MYHNLVAGREPDQPEVSYQVTPECFSRQVGRFAPAILDPQEVGDRLKHSQPLSKGFLLTFDDGAAGLMEGIPTLQRHRARAVVFVCPGQLASGLWCYRLAHLLSITQADAFRWRGVHWKLPSQRMQAHEALIADWQRMPQGQREEALGELKELLGEAPGLPSPSLRTANEEMIRVMADSGCFVFANHTWSHSNLAHLSPAAAEEEIDRAQQWLERSGLPTVPWLAFPHGGFNQRVVEIATSRGLVPFGNSPRSSHPVVRPRVGVYGRDERWWRFEAKLWWSRVVVGN